MSSLPPPAPETRVSNRPRRRERVQRDINVRRRANIVIGAVLVIALAIGGYVGFRVFSERETDAGGFDRVLTLDVESGGVTVYDADGTARDTWDVPAGSRLVRGKGRYVAVVSDDEVSVLDIESGEATATGADPDDVLRWYGSDEPVLASYAARGRTLLLTDAASGEAIDIGEEVADRGASPAAFNGAGLLADEDGARFAIRIQTGRTGATLAFGFPDGTGILDRPGSPVAVSEEGFVTYEGTDDQRGRVTFYDHAGEERQQFAGAPEPAGRPIAVGDAITYVDDQGRVFRGLPGDDELERVGDLELGRSQIDAVFALGDRIGVQTDAPELIVVGAGGDEQGRIAGEIETRALGFDTSVLAECIVIVIDDAAIHYGLDPVERFSRGALPGAVLSASPDQCALATAEPATVVVEGTVTELGRRETVADLAPDGTAALVRRGSSFELRFLGDDPGEPVRLDGNTGTFAEL